MAMKTTTAYIIAIIIALLFPLGVRAGSLELTERADSAYKADDFGQALELYRQAADDYGVSAALYGNIGNCQYRLGNPGQAILAYERGLRLDPTNEMCRTNLEFVSTKITDRPGEQGSFLSNTADRLADSLKADTWAWIALCAFILTLGCVMVYVLDSETMIRKIAFFGGAGMILITAFLVMTACHAASRASDTSRAVITAPSTILSTTPRQPKDRTEEAMMLHEGTRITLLDSVSSNPGDTTAEIWYDARIDNAHRAWIRGTDIEKIAN